jgi:putative endonuclease
MSNRYRTVLYIGVTSSLEARVAKHKAHQGSTFTKNFNCNALVYYETFTDIRLAIAREKQLKNWKRSWKDELIDKSNPLRRDLSEDWS